LLLFSLCTECFDLGAFVVPRGIPPPPSQMEEAIAQLQAKDTKERMAGVERLQVLLEQSRKSLSPTEVGNLVDASVSLLKDHNFRVCEGALQALASAAALAGEHLKVHFNALLPLIVERLGDGKQSVRDAGRRLLLALMEISSPTLIVERAGNFAWCHKNWRVREEFARTVASATHLFAATELPFQRVLLPSVLHPPGLHTSYEFHGCF
jgi:CLIP-associating protein 1/2